MVFYRYSKTYTVNEFLELQRRENIYEDIKLVEKIIENIKTNKALYFKVVFIAALLLRADQIIYASSFEDSLNKVGNTMVEMFIIAAKWGCIGMGFKNMLTTLVNGGNVKNAINEGVQYIIAFIFFQLYPQLYTILRGIKF